MKRLLWMSLVVALSFGCSTEDPGEGMSGLMTDASVGSDSSTVSSDGAMDSSSEPDSDGDGLSDREEESLGTNPDKKDSDGDGLSDKEEVDAGTNPTDADPDMDGLNDATELALGTNPSNPDSDMDGRNDGEEIAFGTDPTMKDELCAADESAASEVSIPVDIIIAIDNSGSMEGEAEQVRNRLNDSLARILDESGIDYRVIMIAKYGHNKTKICIKAPLSLDACDGSNSCPTNGPRFFHVNRTVESTDAMERILETYDSKGAGNSCNNTPNGWGEFLREGSKKMFLVISDDNSRKNAEWFDQRILAKSAVQFGTAANRNYIYHSIIGIRPFVPETSPWPADATIQSGTCGRGAVNSGRRHQELSRLSRGLRFPICNNDNFDTMFQALAADVIMRVQIPCSFKPEGDNVDLENSRVVYRPGNGGPEQELMLGADINACDAAHYYIDNNAIKLCDAMCNTIESDTSGMISLEFGCGMRCGDGHLDAEEECDDGNVSRFDGCSPICKLECGNGVIETDEECDDGNHIDNDGCSSECKNENVIE